MTPKQNRLLHIAAAKIWGDEAHDRLHDLACETYSVKSLKDLSTLDASKLTETLREMVTKNAASVRQMTLIRNLTRKHFGGDSRRMAGWIKKQTGKQSNFDLTKPEATKVITGVKRLAQDGAV